APRPRRRRRRGADPGRHGAPHGAPRRRGRALARQAGPLDQRRDLLARAPALRHRRPLAGPRHPPRAALAGGRMKDIPIGLENRREIMPEERHTASFLGNAGVHVVSTPALIGFLELTAMSAIIPYCEAGESSVGTRVEVDHLAAAVV